MIIDQSHILLVGHLSTLDIPGISDYHGGVLISVMIFLCLVGGSRSAQSICCHYMMEWTIFRATPTVQTCYLYLHADREAFHIKLIPAVCRAVNI